MDNVVTQEVFKRIDVLAEKLGVTAAYLWPKLVAWEWAQAFASIIIFFIVVPIAIVGSIKCFIKTKTIIKEAGNDYRNDREVTFFVVGLALALVSVLGVVAFFFGFSHDISTLISPEAATFYKLIGK
jgi:uncharacterized membrane protein